MFYRKQNPVTIFRTELSQQGKRHDWSDHGVMLLPVHKRVSQKLKKKICRWFREFI